MAIDGGMKRARQALEDPFRAARDVDRGVTTAVQACDLQRRVPRRAPSGPRTGTLWRWRRPRRCTARAA